MSNLIDKAKVIEEIKRQIDIDTKYGSNVYDCCNDVLSFINTLEVQEVDSNEHWQEVRERAAIAALQGLSANPNLVYNSGKEKIDFTKRAMRYADELIETLKRNNYDKR